MDVKPVAWVDERAISWLAAREGKSGAFITTKLTAVGPSIERPMPLYDQAALDAAVAAERERCARICDDHAMRGWPRAHAVDCADAIRKG